RESAAAGLGFEVRLGEMIAHFGTLRAETARLSDGLVDLDQRVDAVDAAGNEHRASLQEQALNMLFARLQSAEGALAAAQAELAGLRGHLNAERIDLRSRLDQRLGLMGTMLGLFGLGILVLAFAAWWQWIHRAEPFTLGSGDSVEIQPRQEPEATTSSAVSLISGDSAADTRLQSPRLSLDPGPLAALDPELLVQGRSVTEPPDTEPETAQALLTNGFANTDSGGSVAAGPAASRARSDLAAALPVESGAQPDSPVTAPAESPKKGPEQGAAAPVEPESMTSNRVERAAAAAPTESAQADASRAPATLVLETPRWMIQLIGFRSPESVREFAAAQALNHQVWTLEGSYRGRPWYSVLIGDYANGSATAAAIAALPPRLRALEPIVRRLQPGARLDPAERD
ncbi:MAG: SPOR domain-containing protein, partial [Thiohalocapsa sp.]